LKAVEVDEAMNAVVSGVGAFWTGAVLGDAGAKVVGNADVEI
jgi:hypothetical protein